MDELLKTGNVWTALAVGIGGWLLWPYLRPIAKSALKGGIYLGNTAYSWAAEVGESVSDIVSEAAAEANGHALGPMGGMTAVTAAPPKTSPPRK